MIKKYTNGAWAELAGYKKYSEITFDFSSFPASFQSGGLDMSDYRIYGANDGVGEQTDNLFDYATITSTIRKYLDEKGIEIASSDVWAFTDYIPVEGNTFTLGKVGGNSASVCLYDENKQFISGVAYRSGGVSTKVYITVTGSNAKFARFSFYREPPYNDDLSKIMLVAGSTAPTQYIPFGYQINAVVRSENLFDGTLTMGYYTNAYFNKSGPSTFAKYRSVQVYLRAGTYRIAFGKPVYMVRELIDGGYSEDSRTIDVYEFTCDVDGNVGFSFRNASNTNWDDDPTTVEVRHAESIPIYIGDTPLAQGEYVDYGEQKVYKYVDGELTPTDPPVALPALPTIDGVTVVDFDVLSKPSRMTGKVIGWETMTPKIYENGAWI